MDVRIIRSAHNNGCIDFAIVTTKAQCSVLSELQAIVKVLQVMTYVRISLVGQ